MSVWCMVIVPTALMPNCCTHPTTPACLFFFEYLLDAHRYICFVTPK